MIKQLIRESLERLEDRIIVKKDNPISKGLKYHIDNEIPIHESVFRMGSKSWINLLEECRKLVSEGSMEVGEYDMELLESDVSANVTKKVNHTISPKPSPVLGPSTPPSDPPLSNPPLSNPPLSNPPLSDPPIMSSSEGKKFIQRYPSLIKKYYN